MAEQPQSKDLFTRLTEAGEEAMHKIADMPGAAKLTDAVNTLRTRVDELQKRMRGLDELSAAKPAPRRRTTRAASPKRAKPKEGKATSSEG